MASLNKVFFMGNLTKDPELRYTPSGLAVASFTVASNRQFSTATGEKKTEAVFMRVVVWTKRAELCAEYLSKGSLVFVEGRLQSRSWQGQDGQKRYTIEIIASNVQFLGGTKGQNQHAKQTPAVDLPEQADALPDIDIPVEDEAPNTQNNDVPF